MQEQLTPGRPNTSGPPNEAPLREIHYRITSPALGHFPGRHRSTRGETGFEFRGHASLLDAPDARRLDLHASLRDPFENWIVRVYSQRRSVPVVMVADLSASMGFEGARRKLDVLADLAQSLAWSAFRSGDSFGFVGCDEVVREDLLVSATRARGAGAPLAHKLRAMRAQGRSARGLLGAHRYLRQQRSLVFLVSDFHLPLSDIDALLDGFARHELVPVVIWDALEFGLNAAYGLAYLVDPETGRRRIVWWRPRLRDKWITQHDERRAALMRLFRRHHLRALFIEEGFSADAVSRHFHC